MTGNLIIITSPSGGGKGTLIRRALRRDRRIGFSVSFTTRDVRPREVDGKDYSFISQEAFDRLVDEGEFLEYANVHGHCYGTSRSRVDAMIAEGLDVILEIDVQGAAKVLENRPESVSIFIMPPSFEELSRRLRSRGTEDREEFELRLRNSFEEIRRFKEFQYVVVNEEVHKASKQLEAIILGERQRVARQTDAIQGILDNFDGSRAIFPPSAPSR